MVYKHRIADGLLERKLRGKGAVLIEGPKWCGKTTTAKQQSRSVLDLGDSSILDETVELIQLRPGKLFARWQKTFDRTTISPLATRQ